MARLRSRTQGDEPTTGRLTRRWAETHRQARPWTPPRLPTVIVSPHPDDEVLLFGGLIATQRARGLPVTVIALSDGEAAYPSVDPGHLAPIRRAEQTAALDRLGVPHDAIVRLGLPDGRLDGFEDAGRLAIAERCDSTTLLAAPAIVDHHCDHEAAAAMARGAAELTGAELVSGLFWAWHHREHLTLPGLELAALELDQTLLDCRASALNRHRSQIGDDVAPALLTATELEPMSWRREFVLLPHR